MSLSRRDRAAMVYAYETLRCGVFGPYGAVTRALVVGPLCLHGVRRSAGLVGVRLGRARLALLLRVLLRADAGDFGPVECTGCGDGGWRFDRTGQRCSGCDIEEWQDTRELDSKARYERMRFTPLWETAPVHRGER